MRKGAAQSEVLRELRAKQFSGVLGHSLASCRHRGGMTSAARTPAGLPPARVLVRVLGPTSEGYFTLNGRHAVLAAMCAAVLAMVVRMR